MIPKDTWRLSLALIALGIAVLLVYKTCQALKSVGVVTVTDSTFYWKNRFADEVTSRVMAEGEVKQWRVNYDSLAKLYHTKPREIISFVRITSTVHDTIHPAGTVIIKTDSTGKIDQVEQRYQNPYYDALALVDLNDSTRSALTLTGYDTLSIVTKRVQRGGLFNKSRFIQLDAINANPNVRLKVPEAYTIPIDKEKPFGVGVQVGVSYINGKPAVYGGVGISYNILRFKL